LAVLDGLEREDCEMRSAVMGTYVRRRLREALADLEMVQEVR
jgi:4-aminobutyrate aminotransferase-like enzyme